MFLGNCCHHYHHHNYHYHHWYLIPSHTQNVVFDVRKKRTKILDCDIASEQIYLLVAAVECDGSISCCGLLEGHCCPHCFRAASPQCTTGHSQSRTRHPGWTLCVYYALLYFEEEKWRLINKCWSLSMTLWDKVGGSVGGPNGGDG